MSLFWCHLSFAIGTAIFAGTFAQEQAPGSVPWVWICAFYLLGYVALQVYFNNRNRELGYSTQTALVRIAFMFATPVLIGYMMQLYRLDQGWTTGLLDAAYGTFAGYFLFFLGGVLLSIPNEIFRAVWGVGRKA